MKLLIMIRALLTSPIQFVANVIRMIYSHHRSFNIESLIRWKTQEGEDVFIHPQLPFWEPVIIRQNRIFASPCLITDMDLTESEVTAVIGYMKASRSKSGCFGVCKIYGQTISRYRWEYNRHLEHISDKRIYHQYGRVIMTAFIKISKYINSRKHELGIAIISTEDLDKRISKLITIQTTYNNCIT